MQFGQVLLCGRTLRMLCLDVMLNLEDPPAPPKFFFDGVYFILLFWSFYVMLFMVNNNRIKLFKNTDCSWKCEVGQE